MKKLRDFFLGFTLERREKQAFNVYIMERLKLENLSDLELHYQYIDIQSKLAYRKNLFSFLLLGLMLSILTGVWKTFSEFVQNILNFFLEKNLTSHQTSGLIVVLLLVFMVIGIVILLSLYVYLNETRRLFKRKLLLEDVIAKKNE